MTQVLKSLNFWAQLKRTDPFTISIVVLSVEEVIFIERNSKFVVWDHFNSKYWEEEERE